MAKLKPLLPTLREKKRYLSFEIISETVYDFKTASNQILKTISAFLGEIGLAKAGIWILPDKFSSNKGIIRVNNKYVNELKVALCHVEKIGKDHITIRSLGVSGILKKVQARCMTQ